MNSELFIEGKQVDINQDLASLVTFAIEDLKAFGSRQTSFSKTIVLPGTARNNLLLGHVFEMSISNPYNPLTANIGINFNPSVSAHCIYFQDFVQAFKGTIRLTDIVINKGCIEYEIALTGEIYKLNVALSSGLLEDLDFSAYNHIYSATNIVNSWDNTGGAGYYYPLIDYGNYSVDKHDFQLGTFRPALYAKEYIDKMLALAGFSYDCALFNTARFKSLIIPHNQKQLTKLEPYNLYVGPGATFIFSNIDGTSKDVVLDRHDIVQDYTVNTANTIYTYTGASFSGVWEMKFTGTFKKNSSIPFRFQLIKNGTTVLSNITFESFSATDFIPFSFDHTGDITLNTNDTIEIKVIQDVATSFELHLSTGPSIFSIKTPNGTPVVAVNGDAIDLNASAIPRNVKQIDFLTSIIKLFNLYVWEDSLVQNLVHIKPFVDYYSPSSLNSIDWSYKLDRDSEIRHTPMSEVNAKTYVFTYKSDSDYYNDLYNKRYNEVYGTHTFISDFEFSQQKETVDLIFAATPLVGYAGEVKVYSTILKINNGVEDRTDSVIRILQTKKITSVPSWNIKDNTTVLATITNYGYAGHFDSPDTITNDLNFGATQELFFIAVTGDLTVNQFNVYWSSYMAEITDKDSKLLSAKFRLKPMDILNLDFSKYIYVDGVIFRLYRIVDYNLTIPDTCQVQLLKVINTVY